MVAEIASERQIQVDATAIGGSNPARDNQFYKLMRYEILVSKDSHSTRLRG